MCTADSPQLQAAPIEPHCITRARSRYQLELTVTDLRQIVSMIETNNTLLSLKTRGGKFERHLVTYQGRHLPLIYDTDRKHIVTILPACRDKKYPVKRSRVLQRRDSEDDDLARSLPSRFKSLVAPNRR